MALSDKKILEPIRYHQDNPDVVIAQASAMKELFDKGAEDVRVKLNEVIDEILSEGGASQIGIDQSKGLGSNLAEALTNVKNYMESGASGIPAEMIGPNSGSNVQSQLEWIINQIWDMVLGQIPDGTITMDKLSLALNNIISGHTTQLAQIAIQPSSFPLIIPETNDTNRLQRMLDFAALNKRDIYCPSDEIYNVSSVRVKRGVRSFVCKGVIKGIGTSIDGIVKIDGTNTLDALGVEDCYISLNIDMSSGDTQGIVGDGVINCVFEKNHIYGFTVSEGNKYGLFLKKGSKGNIVEGNTVDGAFDPIVGNQYLIIAAGENQVHWGGYFDGVGGTITRSSNPVSENLFKGNYCNDGTHGFVINAGEYNVLSENICRGQSHRSITLQPTCFYNIVSDNQLLAYRSSAVHLAYGSCHNLVTNNSCIDDISVFVPDGEASINCYVGCKNNKFIGNKIKASRRFGIYLAIDAQDNEVEANTIEGYRLSGIALESDWIPVGSDYTVRSAMPVDAKYSRPNYGSPPLNTEGVQATKWAFGDTSSNIIQNNVIALGSGTTGAEIYLAQIGSYAMLKDNIIKTNAGKTLPTNHHYFYLFEETVGKAINNKLKNNDYLGGQSITLSQFYMSRWRNHFNAQEGNEFLDTARVTFPSGDTTPSVKYGGEFWFANSTATSVTNLIDGVDGQEIVVRLDTNTSLVYGSSTLRLKGNINVTGANGNMFLRLKNLTGIWFEMYRNF